MSEGRSTMTQMARLVTERDRARDRVDELEREARASSERVATASAALVEFERRGGRGAERTKLEAELAQARAKTAEPWAERIAGARTRTGDHQAELQRFVGEHLQELVTDREAEGEAAAARLTEAAERVVAAHREREQIAGEIAQLCSMVGRVHATSPRRRRQGRPAIASEGDSVLTEDELQADAEKLYASQVEDLELDRELGLVNQRVRSYDPKTLDVLRTFSAVDNDADSVDGVRPSSTFARSRSSRCGARATTTRWMSTCWPSRRPRHEPFPLRFSGPVVSVRPPLTLG